MSQQQPRPRDLMSEVWKKIGLYRAEYGKDHVNRCIERGMAGEPDWFYAFEAGHIVGTPFTVPAVQAQMQVAVALGGKFAIVMRPPEQGVRSATA